MDTELDRKKLGGEDRHPGMTEMTGSKRPVPPTPILRVGAVCLNALSVGGGKSGFEVLFVLLLIVVLRRRRDLAL